MNENSKNVKNTKNTNMGNLSKKSENIEKLDIFSKLKINHDPEEEMNTKLHDINDEINKISKNINLEHEVNLLTIPKKKKIEYIDISYVDQEQLKREKFMRERIRKITNENNIKDLLFYTKKKHMNIKSKLEEYIKQKQSSKDFQSPEPIGKSEKTIKNYYQSNTMHNLKFSVPPEFSKATKYFTLNQKENDHIDSNTILAKTNPDDDCLLDTNISMCKKSNLTSKASKIFDNKSSIYSPDRANLTTTVKSHQGNSTYYSNKGYNFNTQNNLSRNSLMYFSDNNLESPNYSSTASKESSENVYQTKLLSLVNNKFNRRDENKNQEDESKSFKARFFQANEENIDKNEKFLNEGIKENLKIPDNEKRLSKTIFNFESYSIGQDITKNNMIPMNKYKTGSSDSSTSDEIAFFETRIDNFSNLTSNNHKIKINTENNKLSKRAKLKHRILVGNKGNSNVKGFMEKNLEKAPNAFLNQINFFSNLRNQKSLINNSLNNVEDLKFNRTEKLTQVDENHRIYKNQLAISTDLLLIHKNNVRFNLDSKDENTYAKEDFEKNQKIKSNFNTHFKAIPCENFTCNSDKDENKIKTKNNFLTSINKETKTPNRQLRINIVDNTDQTKDLYFYGNTNQATKKSSRNEHNFKKSIKYDTFNSTNSGNTKLNTNYNSTFNEEKMSISPYNIYQNNTSVFNDNLNFYTTNNKNSLIDDYLNNKLNSRNQNKNDSLINRINQKNGNHNVRKTVHLKEKINILDKNFKLKQIHENSKSKKDIIKNCENSCNKGFKLQKTMNKQLFIKTNLGKTYQKIKKKEMRENIDTNFLQNIKIEKEDKGLFIYGKNSQNEKARFLKIKENDDNRKLDNIEKFGDEAVYKVREVLMQKFGIKIGVVKKNKKNHSNPSRNIDMKHAQVERYLNGIHHMNKYLINKISNFQEDESNKQI